jgi:hypothetical protein
MPLKLDLTAWKGGETMAKKTGGKMARNKGANFEREVAKLVSTYFPDAQRNLRQYQGTDGRDLDNTQPLCMQLKRNAKNKLWQIKMAYIEARESASIEYPYPVAVWRDDQTTPGEDVYCMMKLSHLIEWLCLLEDGEL